MPPQIKLWYSPSACSLAPHIVLREAGIPFQVVRTNIHNGPPEELRQVNPKMKVPVLEIDDVIITEVPAILTAISQLAPNRHFLGATDLDIVRSYEWMNWISGFLHGQAYGGVFRPQRFSDNSDTHGSIRSKGWNTVLESYDLIESKLNGVHAVGQNFTAVDAYLYVFYRWGTAKVDMTKYLKYTRLVEELLKLESVQDAVAEEGIDPSTIKL